jgi:hypothetical protein
LISKTQNKSIATAIVKLIRLLLLADVFVFVERRRVVVLVMVLVFVFMLWQPLPGWVFESILWICLLSSSPWLWKDALVS